MTGVLVREAFPESLRCARWIVCERRPGGKVGRTLYDGPSEADALELAVWWEARGVRPLIDHWEAP